MRHLFRTIALAFSLIVAWLVPTAQAQDSAVVAAPAASPSVAEPAKPALWKLADRDTTIYFFGTIHVLPADLDWYRGPIPQALQSSQQLITEIPETDPAEMQKAVASHAPLPAGTTLRSLLPADERAKFEKTIAGLGLPMEAFDRFQPWFAALSMALVPVMSGGYDPASGADVRIAAEAKARGIPRMGLETAEYQMKMFGSLPMATQQRYLREVIDGIPTIPQEMANMVREWSAGHADKVAEIDNAEQDDPLMVKALLTDRNRMWATWARLRMKRPGTVFVAVGAGHLAGKDSVIALLGKAGLRAARVQ